MLNIKYDNMNYLKGPFLSWISYNYTHMSVCSGTHALLMHINSPRLRYVFLYDIFLLNTFCFPNFINSLNYT